MPDRPLLRRAVELAREAIELDEAGMYKSAIPRYLDAADTLLRLVRFVEQSSLRDQYFQEARNYMRRAQDLRSQVEKPAGKSAPPAEGTGEDGISKVVQSMVTEPTDLTLQDVAGLEEAKRAMRDGLIVPILRPDIFEGKRKPPRGILLYGPPGCGKSLLVAAIASETKIKLFNADCASLLSKWYGESEKVIKSLFDSARANPPSLIFVDEIDSIGSVRSQEHEASVRAREQFQMQVDGVPSLSSSARVFMVGATNKPWDLDTAFLRRFDRQIPVLLPSKEARQKLWAIHTAGVPLDHVDFGALAETTEGYSGDDIAKVCREALLRPIRELDEKGILVQTPKEQIRPVSMEDFSQALKLIRPTVNEKLQQKYNDWGKEVGLQ